MMSTHEPVIQRSEAERPIRPERAEPMAPRPNGRPRRVKPPKADLEESTPRIVYGASIGLISVDSESTIAAIKKGLPFFRFAMLQKALEVPASALASILRIPVRTLARRKREGRFSLDESERLLRLGALFDRAVEVLTDADHARRWLKSPARALGSEIPLRYADTEPGARAVENVLGAIEHGIYL